MKFVLALGLLLGMTSHAALPEDSLYHLPVKFKNQDGKTVVLESFAGEPVIMSMIYLSCQYTCPAIVVEIKEIIKDLPEEIKSKLRILLVSFDPAHDKPAVLKKFMKDRRLDSTQWTMLTADKDSDVRELAALLDFKYKKDKGNDFTHSYLILALDKNGAEKSRIDHANQNHEIFIRSFSK